MSDPEDDLGALRIAAAGMIHADARMDEIDEGFGGLAIIDPAAAESMRTWISMSGVDHADTVFSLLKRIDALSATLIEIQQLMSNEQLYDYERFEEIEAILGGHAS